MNSVRGTTIVACKRNGKTVIGADSQATLDTMVFKDGVKKLHKIYNDQVVVGMAGSVSHNLAVLRLIEENLNKYSGNLQRALVEISNCWQNANALHQNLEVMMIIANKQDLFIFMGDGLLIRPNDDFASVGSGSHFALGAARALFDNTKLSARDIVEKSLNIASDYCIYTNKHLFFEEVE
ncbi:MAG: ATP-dependent protease subunit HslV [Clostridia bacterium]|nr:ATP-dependent protease subunit HslV [Clostridia bacterium]